MRVTARSDASAGAPEQATLAGRVSAPRRAGWSLGGSPSCRAPSPDRQAAKGAAAGMASGQGGLCPSGIAEMPRMSRSSRLPWVPEWPDWRRCVRFECGESRLPFISAPNHSLCKSPFAAEIEPRASARQTLEGGDHAQPGVETRTHLRRSFRPKLPSMAKGLPTSCFVTDFENLAFASATPKRAAANLFPTRIRKATILCGGTR